MKSLPNELTTHGPIFYLLDYISFGGIPKCGDQLKNKNKNLSRPQNIPIIHSSVKIIFLLTSRNPFFQRKTARLPVDV